MPTEICLCCKAMREKRVRRPMFPFSDPDGPGATGR